jgi:hypothetical protein
MLSVQRRIAQIEHQIRNFEPSTQPEEIAPLEAELKRQSDRRDHANLAFLSVQLALTTARTWLGMLGPDSELQDAPNKYILPSDDERFSDAVDRVRLEIERVASARANVARAVLPIADLRAQADKHVDTLAARGRPVIGVVDRDQLQVRYTVQGYASEAVAFLAWLFPDRLSAKLHEQIDEQRQDELRRHLPVMPANDRVAKLAELDARILELERAEEFHINEAREENSVIPRRENANPAAVLGVVVVPRQAKRAA